MQAGLERAKLAQIGLPHVTPQAQFHAPALALGGNQPCFLQFLDVVRKGCRADAVTLRQSRAGQALHGSDLLQDRKPARLRQGTRDRNHLLRRKLQLPRRCHPFILRTEIPERDGWFQADLRYRCGYSDPIWQLVRCKGAPARSSLMAYVQFLLLLPVNTPLYTYRLRSLGL